MRAWGGSLSMSAQLANHTFLRSQSAASLLLHTIQKGQHMLAYWASFSPQEKLELPGPYLVLTGEGEGLSENGGNVQHPHDVMMSPRNDVTVLAMSCGIL